MYNKPITQRVAFARGKKPSALKQTTVDDTTVLKDDIMATLKTEETVPGPERTEVVKKEGKVVKASKERCGIEVPMDDPRCVAFSKMSEEEIKASEIKQGLRTPDTEEEITVKDPDQKIEKEVPLYGFDRGDVDYTWQQRSRGRQALEGSRKAGKIARKGYEGMSDEQRASSLGLTLEEYKKKDIKNKRQFGKAKKAYEAFKASKSYDAYLESQREASEQGISQGAKGRAKVTVPDRNKYVAELSKADIEEKTTSQQRADFYQTEKNKNERNAANAAKNAGDNQDAVDKRNAQEGTANKDVKTTATMKVGPLKMKSSFKMGGYGSKTYKK
jgi:hypothetical protein